MENMIDQLPVFGICGFSGAGKTTLIEQLLPFFLKRGLKTAVIKHDAHGLNVDREGKDSDRFFKAGADVLAYGPLEGFLRLHHSDRLNLNSLLRHYASDYDLILVEGHKFTPLPCKIWLLSEDEEKPPDEAQPIVQVLQRHDNRTEKAAGYILTELARLCLAAPVNAGILIGGQSSRMGQPKHLIKQDGQTWLERILATISPFMQHTAILGSGKIPQTLLKTAVVLPDCNEYEGPLAGMISAMRWSPCSNWLFLACDMPQVTAEAVTWLLSQRHPGAWAIMPAQGTDQLEPLFAYYDWRIRTLLEESRRPRDMAVSGKVFTPRIPPQFLQAWSNINTPDALQGIS